MCTRGGILTGIFGGLVMGYGFHTVAPDFGGPGSPRRNCDSRSIVSCGFCTSNDRGDSVMCRRRDNITCT